MWCVAYWRLITVTLPLTAILMSVCQDALKLCFTVYEHVRATDICDTTSGVQSFTLKSLPVTGATFCH